MAYGTFVTEPGDNPTDPPHDIDLLFIDSSHQHAETIATYHAWLPQLAPDALVVFHDYDQPDWPGVASGIAELGLDGETVEGVYVWRNSLGC